ncbi:hypothetical protein SAY86_012488 [Trapa natans]|uniref:Protein ABIL1 n=1 Tax=Trapa natans TaxID=22666 RepID=A0AAN7R776_TRANT|nr:hypothetical protein SAY86_012488 [Trapa natans]
MEVEQPRAEDWIDTLDEASMEQSKGFVTALQELNNLRPQLYSAAEYCEKSYLHSEKKQMVLDNLKDYAVKVIVNAVDHLGTVACKLNDLLEQQTLDVAVMQQKVANLHQRLLTCQTYSDQEGLRQHQLLAIIPRHHKHYTLPNFVSKKVRFGPHNQKDVIEDHFQGQSCIIQSGSPAAKTLSWHLASEKKYSVKESQNVPTSITEGFAKLPGVFHLLNDEENLRRGASKPTHQLQTGLATSGALMPTFSFPPRESVHGSGPFTAVRSSDNNPNNRAIPLASARRSMVSAFFVKPKTARLRMAPVP